MTELKEEEEQKEDVIEGIIFFKNSPLITNPIEKKVTEENGPTINGLHTGPDLRFTSQGSFTSLPENDFNVRTVASFRSHQYNLKLSITKALMDIIDEQKSTF